MPLFIALSRLLTVLAVIGLVMGAATAPSVASTDRMPAMSMSGDMLDCEGKTTDCDNMKSCPFMVVCVAKLAQALPTIAPIKRRSRSRCGSDFGMMPRVQPGPLRRYHDRLKLSS